MWFGRGEPKISDVFSTRSRVVCSGNLHLRIGFFLKTFEWSRINAYYPTVSFPLFFVNSGFPSPWDGWVVIHPYHCEDAFGFLTNPPPFPSSSRPSRFLCPSLPPAAPPPGPSHPTPCHMPGDSPLRTPHPAARVVFAVPFLANVLSVDRKMIGAVRPQVYISNCPEDSNRGLTRRIKNPLFLQKNSPLQEAVRSPFFASIFHVVCPS